MPQKVSNNLQNCGSRFLVFNQKPLCFPQQNRHICDSNSLPFLSITMLAFLTREQKSRESLAMAFAKKIQPRIEYIFEIFSSNHFQQYPTCNINSVRENLKNGIKVVPLTVQKKFFRKWEKLYGKKLIVQSKAQLLRHF